MWYNRHMGGTSSKPLMHLEKVFILRRDVAGGRIWSSRAANAEQVAERLYEKTIEGAKCSPFHRHWSAAGVEQCLTETRP
jgi:hypothetical protein